MPAVDLKKKYIITTAIVCIITTAVLAFIAHNTYYYVSFYESCPWVFYCSWQYIYEVAAAMAFFALVQAFYSIAMLWHDMEYRVVMVCHLLLSLLYIWIIQIIYIATAGKIVDLVQ